MKYAVILLCILLTGCITGGDTDYHFDYNGIDGKQHHYIIHSRNSMLRPQLKAGGCIGEYNSDEVYVCGVTDFTYYTTKPH